MHNHHAPRCQGSGTRAQPAGGRGLTRAASVARDPGAGARGGAQGSFREKIRRPRAARKALETVRYAAWASRSAGFQPRLVSSRRSSSGSERVASMVARSGAGSVARAAATIRNRRSASAEMATAPCSQRLTWLGVTPSVSAKAFDRRPAWTACRSWGSLAGAEREAEGLQGAAGVGFQAPERGDLA